MASNATDAMPDTVQLRTLRLRRGGRLILDVDQWLLPAHANGLLLGPSGSGKTTLLHLLAGLEVAPDSHLAVLGENLSSLSPGQRDRFRARNLGLVFQDFHLLASLNVLENLIMPMWLAGQKVDLTHARQILRRLGVEHLESNSPHTLSQGEKQRIAIARSVINHPRLILADEPTSALDDDNAGRVMQLLTEEAEQHGASLLVASHDQRITPYFAHCLRLEGGE